jgi:di/tricarboxylate transporter
VSKTKGNTMVLIFLLNGQHSIRCPANQVNLAVFVISTSQAAIIIVSAVFLIGLPSAIFIKKIVSSIKWHSKLAQYLVESLLFLK